MADHDACYQSVTKVCCRARASPQASHLEQPLQEMLAGLQHRLQHLSMTASHTSVWLLVLLLQSNGFDLSATCFCDHWLVIRYHYEPAGLPAKM